MIIALTIAALHVNGSLILYGYLTDRRGRDFETIGKYLAVAINKGDETKRPRKNTGIVVVISCLIVTGLFGLAALFVSALSGRRVADGVPIAATAKSPYESKCCPATVLFNQNQVSVYLADCELKVRDDLKIQKGGFVTLSLGTPGAPRQAPLRASDAQRNFYLELDIDKKECK
jgi:hypothetical protein